MNKKLAERIFSALNDDNLCIVYLLGQGRYTIPPDSEVKAAIEVAITEAQETED